MADLRDLAGAYALDALDDAERHAFEQQMARDPELRAEVERLREAALAVAAAAAADPPRQLRDDVLRGIASMGQDREQAPVFTFPGSSRWMSVAAATLAVAAVILVVVAVLTTSSQQDLIDEILAAEDRVVVQLEGDALFATFTFSPGLGDGVFESPAVPAVPDSETYQLWLIGDAGPESAGLFTPEDDGTASVLVDGDVASGRTVGLTVEPAGGSPQPTGDVIVAAQLP